MAESDWGTRLKNNSSPNLNSSKEKSKPEFGSIPINEGCNTINSDYSNYEISENSNKSKDKK